MQIRLDKYLADMGIGTRSQIKQYIRKNQVQVNGSFPKGPEQKVNPEAEIVTYMGNTVSYVTYEYYMFYKPQGCVSATKDHVHKTVLDYMNGTVRKDLFPVGRLDIDTEGLLLITNDGALSHNLLAPGKHVPKTYYARVSGRVTEEDIEVFHRGVDIGEGTVTMPAELEILSCKRIEQEENDYLQSPWASEVELTIMEGKFHQVKRMFEAIGKKVVYLKRISIGKLKLDETLKPGEYRALTEEELKMLK